MSPISAVFSSIINGKNNVCCLCLSYISEEPIRLTDEVVIDINNGDCDTAVEQVLNNVFDEEMYSYISSMNSICEQCIKQAINYYKFLRITQRNAEYFTNVLNSLTNSFEYISNELYDSKSLFVSLNLQDFTSKHYYDEKRAPSTSKAALKRFQSLDNTQKVKIEDLLNRVKKEKDSISQVVKRKAKNVINIPTSEMLIDKNNRNNLKCKECLKKFPTIWNLRNHYIRVHAPKTFKCPECPRRYGSAAFLEAHKTESHCTVVCTECGKTFNNRHTLKMHEIGHHLTLVCHDCGRIYKNKSTFKKHIDLNVCGQKTRANPSEAKYTCDHCNKKYTQKMSLRVHIQLEHGNYKAHICEWCGKKFWAQSRLKAHIVKHTREKNFPCTLCGGKFVSKESLLYHTRIHTGEKPYKCPHCDARFISASRRTDHVKRHHLGGTFECDICHSKFNSRPFLLKHKKMHTEDASKPNQFDQSRSMLKNSLNSDMTSRDIWKIDELDDVGIQSFQNVIESAEVQIQSFGDEVYEDTKQSSEDGRVYLEVSDDADEFIKLAGIGT
ncbi:uncharacterized protein LOC142984283 [Anticarsia gemmatalis]|uniref:uncharacterized protein LOC142984283 n=1 Tax=Anticarsia gemmatalis TaxID=129554 RepID=UPI003F76197A